MNHMNEPNCLQYVYFSLICKVLNSVRSWRLFMDAYHILCLMVMIHSLITVGFSLYSSNRWIDWNFLFMHECIGKTLLKHIIPFIDKLIDCFVLAGCYSVLVFCFVPLLWWSCKVWRLKGRNNMPCRFYSFWDMKRVTMLI
jgi:hypothetical protein